MHENTEGRMLLLNQKKYTKITTFVIRGDHLKWSKWLCVSHNQFVVKLLIRKLMVKLFFIILPQCQLNNDCFWFYQLRFHPWCYTLCPNQNILNKICALTLDWKCRYGQKLLVIFCILTFNLLSPGFYLN